MSTENNNINITFAVGKVRKLTNYTSSIPHFNVLRIFQFQFSNINGSVQGGTTYFLFGAISFSVHLMYQFKHFSNQQTQKHLQGLDDFKDIFFGEPFKLILNFRIGRNTSIVLIKNCCLILICLKMLPSMYSYISIINYF